MARIYVASLSDYNNGTLHGKWINLDFTTAEEVQEQVYTMLRASTDPGAEEWAIHDYELGGFDVEEYTSFEHCVQLADLLEEYGEKIVGLYNNNPHHYADNLDDLTDNFDDYYRGAYDSKLDYAMEYADQELENLGIELPYMIPIDYEGVLINLECNGTWFTDRIDGEIHAFDQ